MDFLDIIDFHIKCTLGDPVYELLMISVITSSMNHLKCDNYQGKKYIPNVYLKKKNLWLWYFSNNGQEMSSAQSLTYI